MQTSNQFLDQFETFLRDIIRDGIREAQAGAPTTVTPPRDRIGGIKLFCEVTGMAEQTGYNMASQGKVPFAKRGGKLVFSEAELRAWMLEERHPTKKEAIANAHQLVESPRRKGSQKR